MPSAAETADSYHATQARLSLVTAAAAVSEWRKIDGRALDRSWLTIVARLLALLSGAQARAASTAAPYLDAVLRAQDAMPAAGHEIATAAFRGIASDGRPLDTLLYSPVITARQAMSAGATVDDALARAQAQLAMLVRTQVQDTGRMAVQTAMADNKTVRGYLRVVHLPCCARCMILAGRFYRYSAGFQRHPNDHCTMMPAAEVIEPQDPADLLAAMRADHPAYLARSLSGADLQALDHGADLSQVVNAHRGMTTAGATRDGTTRRGVAGQRLRGQLRPTPGTIFAQAASEQWTRQQIVAQLMRAGYLI